MEGKGAATVVGGRQRRRRDATNGGANGVKIKLRVACNANELTVPRGELGETDRAELARPEQIGRLEHELLHDVWLSLAPSWVAGHLYASLH